MVYKRIRDLREDKDMTQTQISQILHCSQRIYSNYERGDVDIPTSVLIRLADFNEIQDRIATLSQKFYHAVIVGVNVVVDGILTVRSGDFLCFAV